MVFLVFSLQSVIFERKRNFNKKWNYIKLTNFQTLPGIWFPSALFVSVAWFGGAPFGFEMVNDEKSCSSQVSLKLETLKYFGHEITFINYNSIINLITLIENSFIPISNN